MQIYSLFQLIVSFSRLYIGCNTYTVTYHASFRNSRTLFMILLKREIHLRNI